MKLTPVLFADSLEASIGLWSALGFRALAEVPHGEGLGFVLLEKDGIEVMLQSRASLAEDLPAAVAGGLRPEVAIYLEVPDLDAAAAAIPPEAILVPRRETAYGARETWFRAPSGHLACLAQRIA